MLDHVNARATAQEPDLAEYHRNFFESRCPHHCALLNASMGDPELRVDCAEHQSANASASRA